MSVDVQAEKDGVLDQTSGSVPRRSRRGVFGLILILIMLVVGIWFYLSRGTEDTDDAEIDGHLIPIASRIDGTVKTVAVEDSQAVKAGDLLVEMDP